MAAECAFVLPSGKKCRCVATRHQRFCRHHVPGAKPPLIRGPRRYSRLAHWRDLGRSVATLPVQEIPIEVYGLLQSLLDEGSVGISDRVADRLLRGLLRRCGSVPLDLPSPPTESSPEMPGRPQPALQSELLAQPLPHLPLPRDPEEGIRQIDAMLEKYGPLVGFRPSGPQRAGFRPPRRGDLL